MELNRKSASADSSALTIANPHQIVVADADRFDATNTIAISAIQDWSNSATELIDTTPLPWTRGLFYCLLVFIAILVPWSFLYQMDEIGTARGRLELKGNTVKREADIGSNVAVVKVYVKKGDRVKAGQPIMELDPKGLREQIYQLQLKIDGQRQHLNQLALMKNQIGLGATAQQQQNQAQLLEKQSQISQADRTFNDRQASLNLQKAEKLTQIQQSQQKIVDAQASYTLAHSRFKDAQGESNRYRKLYKIGAIAQIKSIEIEGIAKDKKQQLQQLQANLQQSKLQLVEQKSNYQRLLQQAQSEIERARLQLTEQQRSATTLTKSGRLAMLGTERQTKEIHTQIIALQSEMERDRAQLLFLNKKLTKYTISSATDGTIFELPIDREGAVVQPKQLIAEIAPNTNQLVFKGEIAADRSESLRLSINNRKARPPFIR